MLLSALENIRKTSINQITKDQQLIQQICHEIMGIINASGHSQKLIEYATRTVIKICKTRLANDSTDDAFADCFLKMIPCLVALPDDLTGEDSARYEAAYHLVEDARWPTIFNATLSLMDSNSIFLRLITDRLKFSCENVGGKYSDINVLFLKWFKSHQLVSTTCCLVLLLYSLHLMIFRFLVHLVYQS